MENSGLVVNKVAANIRCPANAHHASGGTSY